MAVFKRLCIAIKAGEILINDSDNAENTTDLVIPGLTVLLMY